AASVESAISDSTSVIADLRAREREMAERIGELERRVVQSDYDSLTRALTRRAFAARAARLLAIAVEYHQPCAVGFVDVDNLKQLNDTLGHPAGDTAIVTVCQRLNELTRGRGILGRMGGD